MLRAKTVAKKQEIVAKFVLQMRRRGIPFYTGRNNDKISLQFRNHVILIKHKEMKRKMLSCCCS